MNRTEFLLAIIAYTLIAGVLDQGGEDVGLAALILYILLFVLPLYVVIAAFTDTNDR